MWIPSRTVTTRKMIALTFRRVLERLMSPGFELEKYVDPVIPTTTAAMRARWMRCLFEVILEIGFFEMLPLTISLHAATF